MAGVMEILAIIVVPAFLVIVGVGVLRLLFPSRQAKRTDRSIEILNERLARGEISRQEYKELKRELR